MAYNIHTLSNGIRIIHIPESMPISYVGVAIDAGTRDELSDESGMAHFVEHMLFKGTTHRRSWHIINRLESVGGQFDAYTTKEETYVYATVPSEYSDRALELLSDVVFNSTFPDHEMDKERIVVIDEIQSYNDSPSDLIYDEFEELLFPDDSIGRNILGTEESLCTINSERMKNFVHRCHTTDRMVIFAMGNMKFDWLVHHVEKYFSVPATQTTIVRNPIKPYKPSVRRFERDTYQSHCMIGNRCADLMSDERLAMVLLNNILGGPNMISRLNLAVRERNGLCYAIESNVTNYTDTGVWSIYFGCDPHNLNKAKKICMQQLDILCNKPLNETQLAVAKRQLRGQVLIGNQNKENIILSVSKNFLHGMPLHTDDELLAKIDSLTAYDLQVLAQKVFNPSELSILTYVD